MSTLVFPRTSVRTPRQATVNDPNKPGGTLDDARIVLPIIPYKVRATMSATYSLAGSGASFKLPLDTVASPGYDQSGSFNTSTNQFVVPYSGSYLATGKVNFNIGSAALTYLLALCAIYQNGVAVSPGFQVVTGSNGTALIPNTGYDAIICDTYYFNEGDLIELHASQQNSAGVAITVENQQFTYLNLHLFSR